MMFCKNPILTYMCKPGAVKISNNLKNSLHEATKFARDRNVTRDGCVQAVQRKLSLGLFA